jgi:carboxymethylenebutenolidase
VLGLYAGRDAGIALESVRRCAQALQAPDASRAARASEIVVYPEAQHGFYADYRPSTARKTPTRRSARAQSLARATHGVAAKA